jgi:phospholipid/cholesterol/gamma-HCH transport system substrate-binding protein
MYTPLVRRQLTAFTALSALVMTVIAINYLDLPHLLGFGQYQVTALFAHADGLYAGGEVTYRGVPVGTIKAISLAPDDVAEVELAINNGVQVPRMLTAHATSMSAIGEQSVDLVPDRPGSPYLAPGDVIELPRTTGQPSAAEVLDRTNALLASIPKAPSPRLLDEVTTAFSRGPADLGPLLDATQHVLDQARANQAPTINLIRGLGPFLDTQLSIAGDLRTSSANLASFTSRLWSADPALRGLMADGPPALNTASGLLDHLRPNVPPLLDNLTVTGNLLRVYLPGIRQTLVIYPAIVAAVQSMLTAPGTDPGTIRVALRPNVGQPPTCFPGFLPLTQQRPIPVTTPRASLPHDLYCKAPPPDPRAYRGSRNIPCLNAPGVRAASAEECLGRPIDSLLQFATTRHR